MRYRYEEYAPTNKTQYVIAVGVHELRALLGATQAAIRNAPSVSQEERDRLNALRSSQKGLIQAIKIAEENEDTGKRRNLYSGQEDETR